MPTFFHKIIPKTVRAYSLEGCPEPIDEWTTVRPNYQTQKATKVNTRNIQSKEDKDVN